MLVTGRSCCEERIHGWCKAGSVSIVSLPSTQNPPSVFLLFDCFQDRMQRRKLPKITLYTVRAATLAYFVRTKIEKPLSNGTVASLFKREGIESSCWNRAPAALVGGVFVGMTLVVGPGLCEGLRCKTDKSHV